jgi:uncharacterized protein YajQ (UPF0234 family)
MSKTASWPRDRVGCLTLARIAAHDSVLPFKKTKLQHGGVCMPSYDIVSKLDMGEIKNALDQARREIDGRYDFKGSNTTIELKDEKAIEVITGNDYQVKACLDIIRTRIAKRGIGMRCLEPKDAQPTGNRQMKQVIELKSGIDKDSGKIINKIIKDSKLKLSGQYMDERVRVTGKSIDDLQSLWAIVKASEEIKVDLQMENMKR